jgi:hypothetical protein
MRGLDPAQMATEWVVEVNEDARWWKEDKACRHFPVLHCICSINATFYCTCMRII